MIPETKPQRAAPYFLLHLKGGQTRWHQSFRSLEDDHISLKVSDRPHLCFRFSEEKNQYEIIPMMQQ